MLPPLLLGALCLAHGDHEEGEEGSRDRVLHSLSATVRDIDKTVQETVDRSQKEASDIIVSAMQALKEGSKEIKVKEPKAVPIETDELERREKAAEQKCRDAILEANQKLWKVFKAAVVVDQGDNSLLKALEGPTRRRRHAEEGEKKEKGRVHDVDSVAHKFHDQIEEILGDCDEKVREAFDNIFDLFGQSLKKLFGDHMAEGTIQKQKDEMTDYGIQAGEQIVKSQVVKVELDLGDGLVCAAKLKGASKKRLDAERVRLSKAIDRIQSPDADGELLESIKKSTLQLRKEYEEIHDMVVKKE